MPFAPSILEDRWLDYTDVSLSSTNAADYMMMTVRANARARDDLQAAIHHGDHTMRPHVVRRAVDPRYHSILKRFEARTGIGGLLNTSLNIHGEPIAWTPSDAVHVFLKSKLSFLALENWMLTKRD
jgi:carbamoyltransferase